MKIYILLTLLILSFYNLKERKPNIGVALYKGKKNYQNILQISKKIFPNTEIIKKNKNYDIIYNSTYLIPKILKTAQFNWIHWNKITTLTNKKIFTKYILKNNLQRFYPETILIGYNDKLISKFQKKYKYFFIKKNLDAKKGLRITKNISIEKDDIIIQPVLNLKTLYGYRFIIRTYWLIKNKQIYLFNNGKIQYCPKKYNNNPLDMRSIINYQLTDKEKIKQKKFINLMSSHPNYQKIFNQLKVFTKLFVKKNPFIGKDPKYKNYNQYILIGLDIGIQKNNKIKIFEINTNPGMGYRWKSWKKLTKTMFESIYNIILYDNDINNCFTYIE
jgi:hypothetical protein